MSDLPVVERLLEAQRRRSIANFFVERGRQQVAENGYFKAAQRLRKQGVPLGIALLILIGRS